MGALNQQPVVRTTRAQELRQRAIAKENEQPALKKTHVEEKQQIEQDSLMEVSLSDEAKKALQEQIRNTVV